MMAPSARRMRLSVASLAVAWLAAEPPLMVVPTLVRRLGAGTRFVELDEPYVWFAVHFGLTLTIVPVVAAVAAALALAARPMQPFPGRALAVQGLVLAILELASWGLTWYMLDGYHGA